MLTSYYDVIPYFMQLQHIPDMVPRPNLSVWDFFNLWSGLLLITKCFCTGKDIIMSRPISIKKDSLITHENTCLIHIISNVRLSDNCNDGNIEKETLREYS